MPLSSLLKLISSTGYDLYEARKNAKEDTLRKDKLEGHRLLAQANQLGSSYRGHSIKYTGGQVKYFSSPAERLATNTHERLAFATKVVNMPEQLSNWQCFKLFIGSLAPFTFETVESFNAKRALTEKNPHLRADVTKHVPVPVYSSAEAPDTKARIEHNKHVMEIFNWSTNKEAIKFNRGGDQVIVDEVKRILKANEPVVARDLHHGIDITDTGVEPDYDVPRCTYDVPRLVPKAVVKPQVQSYPQRRVTGHEHIGGVEISKKEEKQLKRNGFDLSGKTVYKDSLGSFVYGRAGANNQLQRFYVTEDSEYRGAPKYAIPSGFGHNGIFSTGVSEEVKPTGLVDNGVYNSVTIPSVEQVAPEPIPELSEAEERALELGIEIVRHDNPQVVIDSTYSSLGHAESVEDLYENTRDEGGDYQHLNHQQHASRTVVVEATIETPAEDIYEDMAVNDANADAISVASSTVYTPMSSVGSDDVGQDVVEIARPASVVAPQIKFEELDISLTSNTVEEVELKRAHLDGWLKETHAHFQESFVREAEGGRRPWLSDEVKDLRAELRLVSGRLFNWQLEHSKLSKHELVVSVKDAYFEAKSVCLLARETGDVLKIANAMADYYAIEGAFNKANELFYKDVDKRYQSSHYPEFIQLFKGITGATRELSLSRSTPVSDSLELERFTAVQKSVIADGRFAMEFELKEAGMKVSAWQERFDGLKWALKAYGMHASSLDREDFSLQNQGVVNTDARRVKLAEERALLNADMMFTNGQLEYLESIQHRVKV